MKKTTVGVLISLLILSASLEAAAQQRGADQRTGRLLVGGHLGLGAGTADDDTAVVLALTADYFPDQNFSIGPLFQLGVTGDLVQFGMSAQAKYTLDLPRIPQLKPNLQAGLGFLYMDMDRPPAGLEDDDLGFLVPFGMGLDLELAPNLTLGSTILLNFTDADIQGERVENLFMTWLFGLKVLL